MEYRGQGFQQADMHNQSLQMWWEVGTWMQASAYAYMCV